MGGRAAAAAITQAAVPPHSYYTRDPVPAVLRYVLVVMLLLLPGAPALPAPVAGEFSPSYFDGDGDGVDDRLAPLLAQGAAVNIFLVFDVAPGAEQRRVLASLGLEPSYESHYLPVWQLDGVPAHNVGWLTALPDLRLVEWQAIYYPLLSYSVPAVKARDSSTYDDVAWDRGLQGAGVNIAILDTGVDNEHETFEGRFIAGVDCVGGCNSHTTEEDSGGDPDDRNGHGTHTASTALGTGGETDDDDDGEPDYMGVAPEARLVDVKVMTDLGAGGNVLQGIEWCTDHADEDWGSGTAGIQVMSMSVGTSGGSDGSDSVSQAANAAVAAGIVAVAAMGNDGDNVVPAPAAGDWVIAVGATDDQDSVDRDGDPIADYSNYGPRDSDGDDYRWDELKPDVVAPGSGIRAAAGASAPFTIATDGYTDMSGTSMSCPHVAGLAALMLQDDPGLEPGAGQNEVMWRMRNFSEQWGPASEPDNSSKYNYVTGWGYADAWAFVNVAQADGSIAVLAAEPDAPVEGDTVRVSTTVENSGDAMLEEATLTLHADSTQLGSTTVPELGPGATFDWGVDWEPLQGDYTLLAEVSAEGDGDTSNDQRELEVSVAPPPQGVDLALAALATDPAEPIHNEPVTVTATVRNQGDEPADSFEVRFYEGSSRFATIDGDALAAGGEIEIDAEWTASEGNRSLSARIVNVEPQDQNSGNDERSLEVSVAPPPDEPDFAAAALEIDGTLQEGVTVTINFVVRNLGQTNGEVDVTLELDGNALEVWDGLAVDGGAEEALSVDWEATAGDHRLEVVLSGADPAEASTANNEAEFDFEIEEAGPLFIVEAISTSQPLTQGIAATVTVTVANDGGADGSVTVQLAEFSGAIGEQYIEVVAGNSDDVLFSWTPATAGSIQLTAAADDSSRQTIVMVSPPANQQPLAVAQAMLPGGGWTAVQLAAVTGQEITFSAAGSSDPDGDNAQLAYAWSVVNEGGMPFSQQSTVIFTTIFNTAGTYTATLTVTDERGGVATAAVSVVVSPAVTSTGGGGGDGGTDWVRLLGLLLLATVMLAGGAMAWNRLREDEDYFDDYDDGPLELACPACQGQISVATPQRPVQLGCPHCQSQFVLRE